MLNAKYAKILTDKMKYTGGTRKGIYCGIFECISYGQNKLSFYESQTETLNWVLEDLVDMGYKVTRCPVYCNDVKVENKYKYTIEW